MLFFALGVFALLFGFAGDAHAVQCQGDRDNVAATLWNKGGICDFPITYDDPGGSGLVTCQYQAINWTESIDPDDPAGWGPAVANPDSCTGTTALMKSGGIVIGSAGNCTLNGPDTCHLYWKAMLGQLLSRLLPCRLRQTILLQTIRSILQKLGPSHTGVIALRLQLRQLRETIP